jgi:hypothetical protein
MQLATEPDIYSPNIGEQGIYVDYIPRFSIGQTGITCPCGSRKENVFRKISTFSSHIKTKVHQKWLEALNSNKTNHYIELEKAKITIENQRLIIARLENTLSNKNITVDYLTNQLVTKKCHIVNDLLDFE